MENQMNDNLNINLNHKSEPNNENNLKPNTHTPLLNILFSIYLFSFLRFIYLKIFVLPGKLYTLFSKEEELKEQKIKEEIAYENKEIKEEIAYENKYMKSYQDLSDDYFLTEEELNNYSRILLNNEKTEEEKQEEILKTHLDKLINSIILEKTPIGNVIMFYNNNKESFEYYSDATIPYRYLETIARKYVITFKCKKIYIDMTKELKKYEEKCKEKIEENRIMKEMEDIKKVEDGQETTKKSVFAKFKTYNKEAGSGKVNTAPPPKNSMPNINSKNINSKNNDNAIQLLKEKSNRFTCMGKFANYNMLKKIDLKLVNKKYNLTFSEYKKLNNLKI